MMRRALACVLVILQAGSPALTQVTPAQQQRETVLRATSRLVQVSVIVQDRNGNPIRGLTKDDFTITDNGAAQPVGAFSISTIEGRVQAGEPLPPNTFTNRYEYRAAIPQTVTVVLFDLINTAFEDTTYARNQIIEFLKQLQPSDRVALYVLGNHGVKVLHEFTNDAAPLLAALQRMSSKEGHQVQASDTDFSGSGIEEFDSFFRDGMERMANFYLEDRVQRTVSALEQISRHLQRLPGRKNLVWVSSAFPAYFGQDQLQYRFNLSPERGNFGPVEERAARALNDANIAIYPVDARGLIGPFGPAATAARGTAMGRPSGLAYTRAQVNIETMVLLAQRTGGQAFYNTNDIRGSVRRAIDDSRVTYELGFYPTHGKWDGRWRELKVKVNRQGVRVRHRRGYFALGEGRTTADQRSDLMNVAAWSPLESTTLSLRVRAAPGEGAEAGTWNIVWDITPSELTLAREEDRWTGSLAVMIAQLKRDGTIVPVFRHTLDLNLTDATYRKLMEDGLTMNRHVTINEDMLELRLVVHDVRSGATGSVRIPARDLRPVPAS